MTTQREKGKSAFASEDNIGGKQFVDDHDRHVESSRHDPSTELHRGLKARQVSMIAIGGAIGTGLIIGTGSALAKAG